MDYEKKDFRKLYEDLVKSDWFKRAYHNKSLGECPFDIPELAESEDEKARKWIYDFIRNCPNESFEFYGGVGKKAVLAYLEKQKYDRMHPVYDNQESFESALDKAWKSYNDSGARTVDGCEDNYTECAYAKGFREGYLFGLQKQKDLDKMIVVSPEVWDKAISDAYENGEKDGEKQKEQKHYWKPTETDVALFNKAVTTNNTLTPAERANLDIIRSKFGCCHAINCSGIMQKEQKSKNELENAFKYYTDRGVTISCEDFEAEPKKEQKPAWSEDDEDNLNRVIRVLEDNDSDWKELSDWLKSLLPPQYCENCKLKRSVENWKPSEEQMVALGRTIHLANFGLEVDRRKALESLYEQLKKLK